MKSSLQTLTRIKKFEIDEQRKLLVAQMNKEDTLVLDLSKLNDEFAKEKEFSKNNPSIGNFGLYVKCYIEKREKIELNLVAVRKKITEIRDIIADIFKEQKTFEIVDANRKKIAMKEVDDLESKMLDEIGTNNYIKVKKNS